MTAFTAENYRGRLAEEANSTRPDREVVKPSSHEVFLNVCLGSSADELWHHGRD